MDMLEIMKKEEAYCADHRDMPGELQKKAKMLCGLKPWWLRFTYI